MLTEAQVGLEQLKEFQEGSLEAFEQLFHAYERAVFRWILRIVRETAAAEDLTIETFWRIFRAHARFDASRPFEPWARRVATRVALDWLKARPPEVDRPEEFFTALPGSTVTDPGESDEIQHKTAKAFRRLSEKLRIVAALVVIEGCTQKEVADALGISISAVKLRVFRAMRQLRNDLEKQGIKP